MNILIVYAHPSNKSYTYKVLQTLLKALKTDNHQVEISDLYKMEFQSDMTEEEYERERLNLNLNPMESMKKIEGKQGRMIL